MPFPGHSGHPSRLFLETRGKLKFFTFLSRLKTKPQVYFEMRRKGTEYETGKESLDRVPFPACSPEVRGGVGNELLDRECPETNGECSGEGRLTEFWWACKELGT